MLIKQLWLTILLGSQIILPLGNAYGQHQVENSGANQIKCAITLEGSSLSQGTPSSVLVQLENVSGKDVTFRARYSFRLETTAASGYGRRGDGYWSPAGVITKEGQLVMVAHDGSKVIPTGRTSGRFPNEAVSLRKGETKQIKVELTELLWQDQILSDWPNGKFFDVIPKGKYWLDVEMDANKRSIKSNRVEVLIE